MKVSPLFNLFNLLTHPFLLRSIKNLKSRKLKRFKFFYRSSFEAICCFLHRRTIFWSKYETIGPCNALSFEILKDTETLIEMIPRCTAAPPEGLTFSTVVDTSLSEETSHSTQRVLGLWWLYLLPMPGKINIVKVNTLHAALYKSN